MNHILDPDQARSAQPFTADELRRRLPTFGWSTPAPGDALVQAYRRYYNLMFEQRFPGLRVRLGQVHVAGFDIAVQAFLPPEPRGTVFVVHGYYDHVGIFDHLIDVLLQQGRAVVTFDLPGHGLSSGVRATIYNFHQYQPVLQRVVQLARNELPQPWHFVGQSTGAAIISEYLLGFSQQPERNPFSSAVLLAPLVRPVNWWFNRHVHTVLSPFRDYIDRKWAASSNDPDFLRFVRNADPLQPRYLSTRWIGSLKQWIPFLERHEPLALPLLIVQGQQDETVDWRHNTQVLQEKFPQAELNFIPEMRHQVVNELPEIRAQVFARLTAFLARQD
ncbi:MAG TPA: alpha/beta hydrolase [Dongiaceae bacterium]|nr:alpha/beta hydrolase [Dongiaceae bacterium]